MNKRVKIGMIQMGVKFHNPMHNLVHAEELVAQAVALGAEICVLPECMDLVGPHRMQFNMPNQFPVISATDCVKSLEYIMFGLSLA